MHSIANAQRRPIRVVPKSWRQQQRTDHDVIRKCKKVPGEVHANQTLLCERDSQTESVTVSMPPCELNTTTGLISDLARRGAGGPQVKTTNRKTL